MQLVELYTELLQVKKTQLYGCWCKSQWNKINSYQRCFTYIYMCVLISELSRIMSQVDSNNYTCSHISTSLCKYLSRLPSILIMYERWIQECVPLMAYPHSLTVLQFSHWIASFLGTNATFTQRQETVNNWKKTLGSDHELFQDD